MTLAKKRKAWEHLWESGPRGYLKGLPSSSCYILDSSWMRWQHARQLTFWWVCAMSEPSLTIARDSAKQAASDWQTVARFALGKPLPWLLIRSRDFLLAQGLNVKLSSRPCSHNSPAARIAALSACGSLSCEHCYSLAPWWCMQHFSSIYFAWTLFGEGYT